MRHAAARTPRSFGDYQHCVGKHAVAPHLRLVLDQLLVPLDSTQP